MELAGRPVTARDVDRISEDEIELTAEELDQVPYGRKRLIENKIHVMDFDNKLVLKPVNIKSIEDKKSPKLNKVSDYDKDGGDAKKLNKKMIDNETIEEDGGKGGPPYSDEQVKKAKELLNQKKSKLNQRGLAKEKSRKEKEDDEYNELMKRKKEKERKEHMMNNVKLSLKTEQAEDGTVFSGSKFSKDDEEEYLGLPEVRDVKVKIPPKLKSTIKKRVKELEKSIRDYDDKGYNDGAGANSNKNKAIDALEQILDNLQSNDYEGFREAQLFFLTLMSPIIDLFPPALVNFLSNGGPGPEGTDELTTKVEPHETELKESHSSENTAVETWFERDRAYVGLYPADDEGGPDTNQDAIVEWWDDAVQEAVEDEFLDPRDWHGSALSYAKSHGLLKNI